MTASQQAPHAVDYRIVSFRVFSHRGNGATFKGPANIIKHVDEIEIYENIELPYLTGRFVVKDDMRFADTILLNGTEYVEIEFESQTGVGQIIKKTFTMAASQDSVKTADNSEVLIINLIEQCAFHNSAITINKAYTGTPDIIIAKILSDSLNLKVNLPLKLPFQKSMKIIIPNLTPFAACELVRSRMSTEMGLPYFLFASLNTRHINLVAFEDMLLEPAWNEGRPYVYSISFNHKSSDPRKEDAIFNVAKYVSRNKNNVLALMSAGSTSGLHTITNMTTGQSTQYFFDIEKLLKDLVELNIINNKTNPIFSANYFFLGKRMNEYNTTNVHRVVLNDTYDGLNNFTQEETAAAFRLDACNNAIRNLLFKNSMSITVPGRPYLTGNNASLGRQIEFVYPANNTSLNSTSHVIDRDIQDKKRSGTFVIYTARHSFLETKHQVDLTAVKLGNLK